MIMSVIFIPNPFKTTSHPVKYAVKNDDSRFRRLGGFDKGR